MLRKPATKQPKVCRLVRLREEAPDAVDVRLRGIVLRHCEGVILGNGAGAKTTSFVCVLVYVIGPGLMARGNKISFVALIYLEARSPPLFVFYCFDSPSRKYLHAIRGSNLIRG